MKKESETSQLENLDFKPITRAESGFSEEEITKLDSELRRIIEKIGGLEITAKKSGVSSDYEKYSNLSDKILKDVKSFKERIKETYGEDILLRCELFHIYTGSSYSELNPGKIELYYGGPLFFDFPNHECEKFIKYIREEYEQFLPEVE